MGLGEIATNLNARAQAGEKEGTFEALYATPVREYFITMLRESYSFRRDQAEDIYQDSAVAASKSFDNWEQNCNFSTWFYTIVRNDALNKIRMAKRRLEPISLDNTYEEKTSGKAPDKQMQYGELVQNIETQMESLSKNHQDALKHFIQDIPYKEIGKMLGISENTARTRVHHARKNLKKKLSYVA